jgi:hypothetical protein
MSGFAAAPKLCSEALGTLDSSNLEGDLSEFPVGQDTVTFHPLCRFWPGKPD